MSEVKTNKISSVSTNGDITLDPDGTGDVIVASGHKLGVGTTSPQSDLSVKVSASRQLDVIKDSGDDHLVLKSSAPDASYNMRSIELAGEKVAFSTGASSGTSYTERMQITSAGTVKIGALTNSKWELRTPTDGAYVLIDHATNAGTGYSYFVFRYNGTSIGGIAQNGTTAVSFNTTSDHRLKENVTDMSGAIARVKSLSPKRFNFIGESNRTVDGFLAHEAQTVVPEAITGTHNEVDDDGNAVMQSIDQSKLVPLLTGALKEAITKIEALEARVTALEDA
ncbi:MAG: tail fiber domain-containing protein [Proteobacteria bacterium]|nr:MAG: tail fiber domain-containing protein [Pseudomonadota bacterium]REJ67668.1 MAG: tail fiber domain-containing protein [Pseudomonadota bacterium]